MVTIKATNENQIGLPNMDTPEKDTDALITSCQRWSTGRAVLDRYRSQSDKIRSYFSTLTSDIYRRYVGVRPETGRRTSPEADIEHLLDAWKQLLLL